MREPAAARVLMIVANPCTNDTRVIKEAEALATRGYRVRVVCKQKAGVPEHENRGGVDYVRVPMALSLPLPGFLRRVGQDSSPVWAAVDTAVGGDWASAAAGHPVTKRVSAGPGSDGPEQAAAGDVRTVAPLTLSRMVRRVRGAVYRAVRRVPSYLAPIQTFTRSFDDAVDEAGRFRPDIVHVHDLAPLPAALKVAAELRAEVVYDAHELERHRKGLNWLGRLSTAHVEARAIKKVNRVITVCNSIADFLAETYNIERPLVVMNSPDVGGASSRQDTIRDRLGIGRAVPLAVYVGNIASERGLEQLVRALPYCEEFHAALLGPRVERTVQALLALAEDLGVEQRFHIVESVAPEEVVPFVSSADVGVVPIQDVCLSYHFCLPNKLFELTFAGIPVCVSDLPELRSFVRAEHTGVTMNEKDPRDIARALREVHLRRSEFIATGERLMRLKAKYGWEVQVRKLVELYENILAKRGAQGSPRGTGAGTRSI